ncbi:MAG: hypothetical protein V4710_23125 [Verrucomicrobiota bacterium]
MKVSAAFLSLFFCVSALPGTPPRVRADASAAEDIVSEQTTVTTTRAPQQVVVNSTRDEPVRTLLETRSLNSDSVELIPTDTSMTTTVIFPDPIEGLDGVGFSVDPNQPGALFNLSFTEGAHHISVHPLKAGARTNLNVFSRGKCYVLLFVESHGTGLFRVSFSREEPKYPKPFPPPAKRDLMVSPARLLGLLDKCKAYHLLAAQHPEVVDDLRVHYPRKITANEGFDVILNAVYRKDGWDTLVFECELTNDGDQPIYYNPEGFSARVNSLVYHHSLADAGGVIPAKGRVQAWFLVTGDDAGGSNSLDPANPWEITLERVRGTATATVTSTAATTTTTVKSKTTSDFKATTK